MRILRTTFLCIALALAPAACSPSTLTNAQYAASTTTLTVETAQDAAVTMYRAEQEAVLAKALKDGAPRTEAEARIKAVREKWQPLWDAFSSVRICHGALVAALQGETEDDDVPMLYNNLIRAQRKLGDVLGSFRQNP